MKFHKIEHATYGANVLFLTALVVLLTMFWSPFAQAVLTQTKHNLSVSGPGSIKATSESEVCVFCHAPHNARPNAPLWNRRDPGANYIPYTSSTTKASIGQPTGASLVCLSCHDGTIALGEVLSRSQNIAMTGTTGQLPAGLSNLGTDLSDDHPVSFQYNTALATQRGELVNPSTLTGKVKLDSTGNMQCTSCHDAHDDSNGKFLVVANQASALCQTCHTKNYWGQSDHSTSAATWNGTGTNPWLTSSGTTVAANACASCHRTHTAGGKKWLMNSAIEENNCYSCHNGNVDKKNLQAEFTKTSIHPVAATTGVHDPAEANIATTRHVECSDCHNPHASKAAAGTVPGSLAGVRGINAAGSDINPVTAESQICFRCHADSTNKPAPRITRQIMQGNTRLEFATGNPSAHPVLGVSTGAGSPSLIAPWTNSSTMGCGDCHNNNAGPGAGGTGPKGPHGSSFAPILERQYLTADRTTESAAAYALCYKCHDRTKVATSPPAGSPFGSRHKQHIVDLRAPCSTCHDPHGISSTQGNVTNNGRLINFDTSIVTPSSSGQLKFVQTAPGKGSCYLRCHGENHNPYTY